MDATLHPVTVLAAALILSSCTRARFAEAIPSGPPAPVGTSSSPAALPWKSPEELVEIGFARSRVVMMNEAHDGVLRCVRTRKLGTRILPTAYRLGVRHLAMETIDRRVAAEVNRTRRLPPSSNDILDYIAHPEMRELIQTALDLGFMLVPYESTGGEVDRHDAQAANLVAALQALPAGEKLLVWSGDYNFLKQAEGKKGMGRHFWRRSGIEPFCIDQLPTVEFPGRRPALLFSKLIPDLPKAVTVAGLLASEVPTECSTVLPGLDAYLISTENSMEQPDLPGLAGPPPR